VEKLREYIRQPSISTENRGVKECAELTRQYLQAAGCRQTEIVPTEGHPGVWGWLDSGASRTLVVYWMYDVQPVNAEEWQSPPFEARIVEDKRFGANGRILRGRGATNQKGPERAFLNAVESVRAAAGKLPVNLMFVCEGEEELGSPHLHEIVNRYSAVLSKAHGVLMPANSQGMNGSNTVSLGNKGIVYMELEANGAASGGPVSAEIHGSNKAIADSPSWRLVQALAGMTDPSGNRILVEGVTAKVRRPTPAERDVYETFLQHYDENGVKRQLGLERFVGNADKREVLRRTWFEPTLNIDGMWAGYTGPGVKTILPHKANVKIDFRLVPDQSAAEVAALVRAHLDKHGFADIKINFWNGYDWSQTDPSSPIVQMVVRTGARQGVQTRVALRNAGSAPMYLFTRNLKLPVVAWGLGHGSGAHSKDEYMLIEGAAPMKGLADAEKGFADLLYAFAAE
jgi:acetylornithine deacetylase/succinyl-diaminopimelate desuccinylase-like protein